MQSATRVLFASVHFCLATLLLISGAVNVLAQQSDYTREREAEHRFTSLESSVATLVSDMRMIKERGRFDWLQQLCLFLLVGERGTAVLKRKQKSLIEEP